MLSFLTQGGYSSRDLIDFTDLYPTFLDLANIPIPKNLKLDGRSFIPSLRGSVDPFEKRSWIYSQLGNFRVIRDWHHLVDSKGAFHDMKKDPLQLEKVNPLDKIAPGRRQRLEMILKRFPTNAPAPFPEFENKHRASNNTPLYPLMNPLRIAFCLCLQLGSKRRVQTYCLSRLTTLMIGSVAWVDTAGEDAQY